MDGSSAEGFIPDPPNNSKLNLGEKREIIYALSDYSHGATEILQSWSRQEILEILCAELGKERKYTGLTKIKIIENLLKVVSEKKSNGHHAATEFEQKPSTEIVQRNPKRQRKADKPGHLPVAAVIQSDTVVVHEEDTIFCQNSACRASLSQANDFCKRCSCCICRQFDDNKDPSLWLTCSSEPPFLEESCGLSCHLECALRHERSGIGNYKLDNCQDGSFCCVSCGKENDAIGSCRKQLLTARDTRRVDVLCYRVSLSQKILRCTKSYQNLCNIVNEAVEKLEEEVGPLTGLPVKRARGIVNRLSCGPEVQRNCNSAIQYLDSKISERARVLSDCKMAVAKLVVLEDVSASSVTGRLGPECSSLGNVVGYTLWHRKADDSEYSAEPTCTLFTPCTNFFISGLTPDTEYFLKVISLDSNRELGMHKIRLRTLSPGIEVLHPNSKNLQGGKNETPAANGSSLSNSSSVEDETSNDIPCIDDGTRQENCLDHRNISQKTAPTNGSISMYLDDALMTTPQKEDGKSSQDTQTLDETSTDNGSNTPVQTGQESVLFIGTSAEMLPITPFKNENINAGPKRSSGKPKSSGKDLDNGSGKEEPHAGSSSKKRSLERLGTNDSDQDNKDFEYYVKVIRWLECDGHIETGFRQKFLTWYSLRATKQEMKIVKVFVDTFIEDPESLSAQLIDTFTDVISNNKSTVVPAGFCLKLWH